MPVPERPEINMSRIKVAGIGGLGMVAIVVIMALELPMVRWFAAFALAGGLLGGMAFIAFRKWVRPEPPHRPTLLVETPLVSTPAEDPEDVDTTARLARVEFIG
jgi:hypothetical protein